MIRKLGIIAGEGKLPGAVVKSALDQGFGVYILRIEGLADDDLKAYPGRGLHLGHIGGAIAALREAACTAVIFAGYIRRPDFADIEFDAEGEALFPRIEAAASKGDDAAISVFVSAFQEAGFQVLGAEEVYRDLLCPEGLMTIPAPSEEAQKDLDKAFHIAGVIGGEDIGQGCVVCDGIVIAVEAQEGTDAMLERAGGLDLAYKGVRPVRNGVLVKRAKPGQERRVDLPVIGVQTVELAAQAGLAGIGLEAGASLILDREETIVAANEAGLFLLGIPSSKASHDLS